MDNLNKENIQEIFFNRADIKDSEQIVCQDCFERVVFMLRDKDHEFSIGLSTVLECVMFAIKNGDLPKLPSSWLKDIDYAYDTGFSECDNISYNDHKTKI